MDSIPASTLDWLTPESMKMEQTLLNIITTLLNIYYAETPWSVTVM